MATNADSSQHLARIRLGLDHYAQVNHRPAIDEPADEFEQAVNRHADLVALQDEVKSLMVLLNADERELRDGLAESLKKHFGPKMKEGMNTYVLSNGRKLKFNYKVERKIDNSIVETSRAAFEQAPDAPAGVTFDDLLRVKYELAKAVFNKLLPGSAAAKAFSTCVTAKPQAPEIKVD